MKEIKVQEMVIGALQRDGKCIVKYCPGHTIPASLAKGDVIEILGKETSTKMIVEVAEKTVTTREILIGLKRVIGLA